MVTRADLPDVDLPVDVAPPAISHPFRVEGGRIATVAPGGIDHAAELVAVTMLTGKGERPLVPDFGLSDPTFAEVDVAELSAVIATHGPAGVRVDLVDAEPATSSTVTATLSVSLED